MILNLEDLFMRCGIDSSSSRYKAVSDAWNALFEKRELAYFNWDKLEDLNFKDQDILNQNKWNAYKSYAYGYLMNMHAYYDSIPFVINSFFGLTDESRTSWRIEFINKLSLFVNNSDHKIFRDNESFKTLQKIVNQWKHRDQMFFNYKMGTGITLRVGRDSEEDEIDARKFMIEVHDILEPLALKCLVFELIESNEQLK